MSRLAATFEKLKKDGHVAFMPYLTAGYPDLETTAALMRALDEAGADVIELGFPFSDPLADGPTIQMASQKALAGGVTPAGIIDLFAELRAEIGCPVVAMTYINPVHAMGYGVFSKKLATAGFDGIIVPDLPVDEGEEFYSCCRQQGMDRILLVAPTSSDERIALASSNGSGFMYCVSLTGVTGARSALSETVAPFLKRVRACTGLPLGLGFGISTVEQVKDAAGLADGVIVGSALIDVMHSCADRGKTEIVREVVKFVEPMIACVHNSRQGK